MSLNIPPVYFNSINSALAEIEYSHEHYNKLIEFSLSSLHDNKLTWPDECSLSKNTFQKLHESTLSILLESAKHNAYEDDLHQYLLDNLTNDQFCSLLVSMYKNHKESLRRHLLSQSFRFGEIVDVEWAADSVILSNSRRHPVDSARLTVTLHVRSGDGLSKFTFRCDKAQLQMLVNELRSICRSVKSFI